MSPGTPASEGDSDGARHHQLDTPPHSQPGSDMSIDSADFHAEVEDSIRRMQRQVWLAFGSYGVLQVLLWLWDKISA